MMKNVLVFGALCLTAVIACSAAMAAERRGGGWRLRAAEGFRDNAPPEIQEIMDKRAAGQELDEAELEKLGNYFLERGARMRGRIRENAPEDVRAIMEKRARGEELTEEEQQRLRGYVRERMTARFGNRGRRRTFRPPFLAPVEANPRDAALLRIAKIKHDQGDHEGAVNALATIIAQSPQSDVHAVAHLAMARIYKTDLALPDKAAAEFLLVRGPMADEAIREMIDMFEQEGEPERGIEVLKNAAAEATGKADKVYFLMHAAEASRRAGQLDAAIETLQEVVELLSYAEALDMKDQFGPPEEPPRYPFRAGR